MTEEWPPNKGPLTVFFTRHILACIILISASYLIVKPVAATESQPLSAGFSFQLPTAVYDTTRSLCVYVPTGYSDSGATYPVLYLLDGGYGQDYLPMVGLSALATLTGQIRPFIVVGIQSENRRYELTAASEVEEDLKGIPTNGGADEFRHFLLTEVKPWVEKNYRTSGEDAVIGESLAALFITETFLRTPESFNHYIAVSPSLWWREMGLSLEAAELMSAENFPSDRSFFLTIGDEGGTMLESVERMAAALANDAPNGTKWWYEPLPTEHHHTIYNPASLRALRHVFAPIQASESP